MKNKLKISVAILTACALLFAAALPLTALAKSESSAPRSGEIWDGSIASSFAGGSGTEDDPYLVTNGAELAYLAQIVNSGEAPDWYSFHVSLENDIYLNDTTGWESWSEENAPANEWTPIGWAEVLDDDGFNEQYDLSHAFNGAFEGNGYTVYGAYAVDRDDMDGMSGFGIFGCLGEGYIDALNVDASFVHAVSEVGAIVGIHCGGVVWGCTNRGTVSGNYCTGGIVGNAYGMITDCVNYGSVFGVIAAGGIAGRLHSTGLMSCSNHGCVQGVEEVGGVAGSAGHSDLVYSSNTASVIDSNQVGGIIGSQQWSLVGACWNCGDVEGCDLGAIYTDVYAAGGISGNMQSLFVQYSDGVEEIIPSMIDNCYNTGSVRGVEDMGGIVGASSEDGCSVSCCYTTGFVGGEDADAIIGFGGIFMGDSIVNCYYLEIEGSAQSPYAEAVTAEQLRNESTYEGFDFAEVWTMEGSEDYEYAELIRNPHEQGGEPQPALPGDADGNGTVNIADGIIALRFTLGLIDEGAIVLENADMNGDGSISVADAILILRIALGL
ncbi:MAG: dockerin type I repeat-containing protein [Clostridia bacterium]|nr:dockerin type I repeat-containing protein [Clostridia bacterium]